MLPLPGGKLPWQAPRSAKHGLDRGKLLQAVHSEFDTEPGLLHAAEGSIWLNRAVLVDPDRAGFDALDHTLGALEIRTPDRASKTHRSRIRLRNGFVNVVVANDGQGRAELFFVNQPATVIDVGN